MKHYHYKFVAYNKYDKERKMFDFGTEITVIGQETEADALHEASNQIKRKGYWLKECWQCSNCGLQEEQLKVQKEVVKEMKKLHEPGWFSKLIKRYSLT